MPKRWHEVAPMCGMILDSNPMANPKPKTAHLKRDAGPGRPKGSKNKLTAARVEEELRRIAMVDIGGIFEKADRAQLAKGRIVFRLKDIHTMPPEMRVCIASVKMRRENLTAGDGTQDETVEVKLWDKVKALELCARYLKMLTDKQELSLTLDERTARLLAAEARASVKREDA